MFTHRISRRIKASIDRRRLRRGSTTVEFALVVPLLFILIFGTFEFTRIMMVKQGMTNAAREG
jgi:Flp pilus assembly protein TadG